LITYPKTTHIYIASWWSPIVQGEKKVNYNCCKRKSAGKNNRVWEVDDTGLRDENCALLGYYTLSNGNFLPTFQNNLSFPSKRFKNHAQLRSCSLSHLGSGRVISCSFLLLRSYEPGLAQLDSNTTQPVSQTI